MPKKGDRGLNYSTNSNNNVILSNNSELEGMSKNKEHVYTTHHLLPRSQWWNSEKQNLVRLRDWYHDAIHRLFSNQLIAQQLITTLDISSKALRPDVKEWLLEVLNTRDINNIYDRYDEGVIK